VRLEEKSIARVIASDTVRVYGHRAGGGHLAFDHTIMSAIGAGTKGDTSGGAALRRWDATLVVRDGARRAVGEGG
jgi:hypothetical protein